MFSINKTENYVVSCKDEGYIIKVMSAQTQLNLFSVFTAETFRTLLREQWRLYDSFSEV